MSVPAVSVVMAARNGARHLGKAIESIQGQTLREIELIVIDDGSSDATRSVAERYARADRRIVVESQEAAGLATALNRGMALARGEWVARMDADDVARPRRLAEQRSYAEKHDLQLCGCDMRTFGATWPSIRRHYRSEAAIRLQLLFGSAFAHPTVLCRTDAIRGAGYDPGCKAAQDYDLWTRLALAGVSMGNMDFLGLDYRVHGNQVTLSPRHDQVGSAMPAALRYWRGFMTGVPFAGLHAGEDIIASLFGRARTTDPAVVQAALRLCERLCSATGDPEAVVANNVFKYLIRASGVDVTDADPRHFRFSPAQRAVLRFLRLGLLNWDSPLLQFARRRLR
jgi:glycosyltransferase involved in cell wall biosynthesis